MQPYPISGTVHTGTGQRVGAYSSKQCHYKETFVVSLIHATAASGAVPMYVHACLYM